MNKAPTIYFTFLKKAVIKVKGKIYKIKMFIKVL